MSTKIAVLITGIKVKLNRGENLDAVLDSYVKLTEKEKEEIKTYFKS